MMVSSITFVGRRVITNGLKVIFLVGLVTMILMRTLRKDYARYSKDLKKRFSYSFLVKYSKMVHIMECKCQPTIAGTARRTRSTTWNEILGTSTDGSRYVRVIIPFKENTL